MSKQPMTRLLAVRHVNGVLARRPWNNEQLIRLRDPQRYFRAVCYNTPDVRKAVREHGAMLEVPPYLICTSWEGRPWTYVHATPDSLLNDENIERPEQAIVVHAWADVTSNQTFLRMHKRGELVGNVVFSGVSDTDALQIVQRESKVFRPGFLKYCNTTGEALDVLLGQVGIVRKRGPALEADGSRFHLTCDPADIESVTVIAYAMPNGLPGLNSHVSA